MEAIKKITLNLPEALLEEAQAITGLGITPTIRRGLELLQLSAAFDKVKSFKGKYRSKLDIAELREDK